MAAGLAYELTLVLFLAGVMGLIVWMVSFVSWNLALILAAVFAVGLIAGVVVYAVKRYKDPSVDERLPLIGPVVVRIRRNVRTAKEEIRRREG